MMKDLITTFHLQVKTIIGSDETFRSQISIYFDEVRETIFKEKIVETVEGAWEVHDVVRSRLVHILIPIIPFAYYHFSLRRR